MVVLKAQAHFIAMVNLKWESIKWQMFCVALLNISLLEGSLAIPMLV